jgi:hypothetical protein
LIIYINNEIKVESKNMNHAYKIGQEYEKKDEELTINWFKNKGWNCTATNLIEHYDFTVEQGNLKYLIETKVRWNITDRYDTLYLNEDKVKYLKEISKENNIPFVIFYAFPKDNIVYLITENNINQSDIEEIQVHNPAKGDRVEKNYIINKSVLQKRKLQ